MYIIFYKTNDVFEAEEKLNNRKISVEVVPTPVQDKAYCGVCIQVNQCDDEIVFKQLEGMDYIVVK